ncbi:hypothetical protein LBMAG53_19940 [Planctomycetota bacterium]|nr:hypothetical protein LBMAG53_19940 [Planctomycetota bacterium]
MTAPTSRRSALDPQREREIIARAESIARDQFGDGPIDPEQLIQAEGITLSRGNYGESFDGLLEYDGLGFHIYANMDRLQRLDEGRGVFTLGHELGHYFIDEHRLWMQANPGISHPCFLFSSHSKDALHEREADLFASSLLMPTASFRRRVRSPAPGAEVILDTATFFRCSVTSTAIRFCELEPFPCAIIRWSASGEYQWGRMSSRVRGRYGSFARDLTAGRSQSLTAETLRAAPGSAQQGKRTTVSELWFLGCEERSQRHGADLQHLLAVLDEHVIPLGNYGVLTVLSGHTWATLPVSEQAAATGAGGKSDRRAG